MYCYQVICKHTDNTRCEIYTTVSNSIVVDCGNPPLLENATISFESGTSFGSNVTYVCNEDKSIKQRTCQASGNWSNEDIRCCKCQKIH